MIESAEFLSYSERVLNEVEHDNDCIEVRSCISRAYYYVFHSIREEFYDHPKAKFKEYGNDQQQKEAQDFFYRIKRTDLADRLLKLKRDRNIADYDLNKDLNKKKATDYLRLARSFVGKMSRNK